MSTMAPRRFSIGIAASNSAEINEWHQKIQDILDIHQTPLPMRNGKKKKGVPNRRRTIDGVEVGTESEGKVTEDIVNTPNKEQQPPEDGRMNRFSDIRDESIASLSWSSNSKRDNRDWLEISSSLESSPASPPNRPSFSDTLSQYETTCSKEFECSPSPKMAYDSLPFPASPVLAKHRINSPTMRRASTGDLSNSPFAEEKTPLPSPSGCTPPQSIRVNNFSRQSRFSALPAAPFDRSPQSNHPSDQEVDTYFDASEKDYSHPSPQSIKINNYSRRLSCDGASEPFLEKNSSLHLANNVFHLLSENKAGHFSPDDTKLNRSILRWPSCGNPPARRSSCGDPLTTPFTFEMVNTNATHPSPSLTSKHKYMCSPKANRIVSRRLSWNDAPAVPYSADKPSQQSPYHRIQNDRRILEDPFQFNAVTPKSKFSIRVHRRSSYADTSSPFPNVPLPFDTTPSEVCSQCAWEMPFHLPIDKVDGLKARNDLLRKGQSNSPPGNISFHDASESLFWHQQHRHFENPSELGRELAMRRASNNGACYRNGGIGLNKSRRRASDCDASHSSLKDALFFKEKKLDSNRPPISLIVCRTTSKNSNAYEKEKLFKIQPISERTKKQSEMAFFSA